MVTASAIALAWMHRIPGLTLHLLGTLGMVPFLVVVVLAIAIALWIARLPSEKK